MQGANLLIRSNTAPRVHSTQWYFYSRTTTAVKSNLGSSSSPSLKCCIPLCSELGKPRRRLTSIFIRVGIARSSNINTEDITADWRRTQRTITFYLFIAFKCRQCLCCRTCRNNFVRLVAIFICTQLMAGSLRDHAVQTCIPCPCFPWADAPGQHLDWK